MLRLTLRLTLLSIFSAHTRTLSSDDASGFVALVTLFNFPYEIFNNLCVCVCVWFRLSGWFRFSSSFKFRRINFNYLFSIFR